MTVRDLIRQYSGDGAPSDEFTEARRIEDGFKEKLATIQADGRLTSVGKQDEIEKLARETREAVEKWLATSQKWSQDSLVVATEELRKAVTPKRSEDLGDRLEAAHRRSEIRRAVAAEKMNAQDVEILYRTTDSPDVRAALEELPRIQKKSGAVIVRDYISPELRAEVLIQAGRRALPDVAEKIDWATSTISTYETIAATLRQDIISAAPDVAKPEPVILSRVK